MSSWWAKFVILASTVAMVAIRAPHGQRSRTIKVVKARKGGLETGLLTFATLTFLLPLVWIASPVFSFADYPLRATNLILGTVGLAVGLWLFYQAHADLGRNWSVTLEIRDEHQLVTGGIYSLVRHPMYLSLLVYSAGQVLVLPNWVVGPAYGVAMALVFAFRLRPEEQMMLDVFGDEYKVYMRRTKRLIPGIW
jgi:protein-S-isoprenylcysteine O-methyltransferase Ste14